MCTSPILIKNPYFLHENLSTKRQGGSMIKKHMVLDKESGKYYWDGTYDHKEPFVRDKYGFIHDTLNSHIQVPCGHCPACLARKQSYIIQRVQLLSLTHDLWMATFTYKNSEIRTVEVNGYKHQYVDFTDFQKMIKRIRQANMLGCDFKYLVVTEYGGDKHRPHIHCLFATPKRSRDNKYTLMQREQEYWQIFLSEWKRNYGTDKFPDWRPLCDLKYSRDSSGKLRCTYQFELVRPKGSDTSGVPNVSFYVTKYCLKYDNWIRRKQQALRLNLDDDKYKEVWSLLKPKCIFSKNCLKDDKKISDYVVNTCIPYSLSHPNGGFVFISPVDGYKSPLSPYIKRKYLTIDHYLTMFFNTTNGSAVDGGLSSPDVDSSISHAKDAFKSLETHRKISRTLEKNYNDSFSDFFVFDGLGDSRQLDKMQSEFDKIDYEWHKHEMDVNEEFLDFEQLTLFANNFENNLQ